MKASPRVVLDTNVMLSALVFKQGRLAAIRQAWHGRHCTPLVSRPTVAELLRALTYPKFRLSAEEQRELLADYLPFCVTVRMPANPPKTPACRDPFDVPFLQLARIGRADYLVSGDDDLLAMGEAFSCPIVSARVFMSELERDPMSTVSHDIVRKL